MSTFKGFSSVKLPKAPDNAFDLGHMHITSLKMGTLNPVYCKEVVPGDRTRLRSEVFLRFMPLVAPMMQRVNVYIHHFFVPNRLLWDGWEDFITGGQDPDNRPAFPFYRNVTVPVGSIADRLGLPVNELIDRYSALPIAAYWKIYNDYYRDQNLISEIPYQVSDGQQGLTTPPPPNGTQPPARRAWRHDYFTSALPFAQKGEAVTIPLGTFQDVPLTYDPDPGQVSRIYNAEGVPFPVDGFGLGVNGDGVSNYSTLVGWPAGGSDQQNLDVDNSRSLKAQTSLLEGEASTINTLRMAYRLQEWLEKNARAGSRYNESIFAHFGVVSPDKRLQRAEYISGSQTAVSISEVLQTAQGNETDPTPQGNMAGHGLAASAGKNGYYYAEEHGFIISMLSVMPIAGYFQGIPKHWSKFTWDQYAWPEFGNLGEQPILNRELWYKWSSNPDIQAENDQTFGYTPRYAEYKYQGNTASGEMQTTLAYWHMMNDYETRPALSQNFIDCVPTDRVFAVQGGDNLIACIYHNVHDRRKLPYYGTPKM